MMSSLVAIGLLAGRVFAQPTPAPAFDAASIKPNHANDGNSSWHSRTGSIDMRNQSLRGLIRIAYHVKDYQVAGGPNWLDAEHYDIVARSPGPAKDAELELMLRTLLADRFQLAFHKESKLFPGYALMVAKKGFKLTPVEDAGSHSTSSRKGHLTAQRTSIARLAEFLANNLGMPVEDMTGLTGVFNFELDWTPDNTQAAAKPDSEFAEPGPSLFTALQEQLGLRLETRKIPAEVLVIDWAERPSEN